MKIYISRKPDKSGGGSNSFAWNFTTWAKKNGHTLVSDIRKAERAIVIAHFAEASDLMEARSQGCYIIHRIDEYFEKNEDEYRRRKHEKIIALNKCADITVFQSRFIYNNAYSFLRPQRYAIIYNGADRDNFRPGWRPGRFIGHVTWGVHNRKKLDILYQKILDTPQEQFLLVGRHQESGYNFQLPNVVLRGTKNRRQICKEYRKMKLLFFPSEDEPCPNIPIEAILSGVPVCYNDSGGTPEIVQGCGEPIAKYDVLFNNIEQYSERCLKRQDLDFERVAEEYMTI